MEVSVAGTAAPDVVKFDPVPDFIVEIPAGSVSATGEFELTPEDNPT